MEVLVRIYISIFIIIMAVCVSANAQLEWRQYGPPGGYVRNICSDINLETFYAATAYSSVYISNDKGENWEGLPIPNYQSGDTIMKAVIMGSTDPVLLAVANYSGVWRWDQSGGTWTQSNNGIAPPDPYSWQFFDINVAAATSTKVFVGCSTGFYYSDDYGDLWNSITLPYTNGYAKMIQPVDDGSVYVNQYNTIIDDGYMYRIESNLTDVTYFTGKTGLPGRRISGQISPNPDDPNEMILLDEEIYYSTDKGETWVMPSNGDLPEQSLWEGGTWLRGVPAVLGTNIAYSLDTSTGTWAKIWERDIADHYGVIATATDEDKLLLWGLSSGIWKSNDSGSSWNYSSNGMSSSGGVTALAVSDSDPRTIYAGFGNKGVWRTKDDGQTWEIINTGIISDPNYSITIRSLAVDPTNPNLLLTGTDRTGGVGKLFITTNGGDIWSEIQWNATKIVSDIHFVESTSGVILAGLLGEGIWRSANNGQTWEQAAGLPDVNNAMGFGEEQSGRIFCGVIGGFDYYNGYVYSDDKGVTWTKGDTGLGTFRNIAADPGQPGRVMAGTGWWGSGNGAMFTSDNGTNWDIVSSGLPVDYSGLNLEVDSLVAIPSDSGTYYLTSGNDVYQTVNEGGAWTKVSDLDSLSPLAYSNRNEGTLFAGSSVEGVYYAQIIQPMPTLTPTSTPTSPPAPPTSTPTQTSPIPPSPTVTNTPVPATNIGVADSTFWIYPLSPRVGDSLSTGVRAFNTGTSNQTNVVVDFYYSTDNISETLLGSTNVPSLPSKSWIDIQCTSPLPITSEGNYYLKAIIDKDNALSETDETDNITKYGFVARQQTGRDLTPPTGAVQIGGGNGLFTNQYSVPITFNATDSESGVEWMYYTAWTFDPYSLTFYPYYESGWIDYFSSGYYFLSGNDFDAISVNYADYEQNVSETYWSYINYTSLYSWYIWYDMIDWYAFYLVQGSGVSLTTDVVWGDVDLFVFAPSTPLDSIYLASVTDGALAENIQFTVPETGVYEIAIFGYDDSQYVLLGSSSGGKMETKGETKLRDDRRTPDFTERPEMQSLPEKVRVPSLVVDINDDGEIDFIDVFLFSRSWGSMPGMENYNAGLGSINPDEPIGVDNLLQFTRLQR